MGGHGHEYEHFPGKQEDGSHLRVPESQRKGSDPTVEVDDPWGYTYHDFYAKLPPLAWVHKRLRAVNKDVEDEVIQKFWKMMPLAWDPKWLVFRFDNSGSRLSWRLKGGVGNITAGDQTEDFIFAQLIDELNKPKDMELERLKAFFENQMFQCKEGTHARRNQWGDRYRNMGRGTQIVHRNCVFETLSRAVAEERIGDVDIQIPSGWLSGSWWNMFRGQPSSPMGPVNKTTFSAWWKAESTKNAQVEALQMQTKAAVQALTDHKNNGLALMNGVPREEFLARVEADLENNLIPLQKELFPKTVYGQDNGHTALAKDEEARRRDAFFGNLKKTGVYDDIKKDKYTAPWYVLKPAFWRNSTAGFFVSKHANMLE